MDICLIHTPVPELQDDRLDPPVGLLYLATVLNSKNWELACVVDLSGIDVGFWKDIIPKVDYYGFSTYAANYHRTLVIKEIVKGINPNAVTIAGGPHASALPDEVLRDDFDYVVMGEGEKILPEIFFSDLRPGIYVGSVVNNLDMIPFPDYSLVDFNSYTREFEGKRSFPIFTSRGCPYRCAFCTTTQKVIRRRSVDNVIEEIESLLCKYGDVSFRFKDDLFAIDVRWIKEFSEKCPDIEYSCNIRADCKPEVIKNIADSGCKWACIGLESGSDYILDRMNKLTTVDNARRTIRLLKDNGVKVLGWFIVGFPGETWNTIYETTEFIREMELDKVVVYPLIPYPGTEIYNNREKYGLRIIDQDFSKYFYIQGNYDAGFVYETDELSPDIVKAMREYIIGNI